MQTINHPKHYQKASPTGRLLLKRNLGLTEDDVAMECIDFLEANDRYCDFHVGNAIKYLWRCGEKDDRLSDCHKALWYLRRWKSPHRHSWKTRFFRENGRSPVRNDQEFAVSKLILAIEETIKLNGAAL